MSTQATATVAEVDQAATVIVLAGGRVIDPANGLDQIADVVMIDGLIAAVGPDAGAAYPQACRRDATGSIVTPGLIDLHTHVFPGLGDFCVHPDRAGVDVGVTTVIDAGTSGTATIGVALARTQQADVHTRVLALVDPCRVYIATKDYLPHRLHLADDPANLDLDAVEAVFAEYGDQVIGLKARACTVDDPRKSPFLEGALSVAGDRPVMVHLGRFPYTPSLSTADTLSLLRGGDIVTHAFRGHSGVVAKDGSLMPEFVEAVQRGVVLDIGHSGADFRFATARVLLDAGYAPSTVSTDLNLFNEGAPVHSLIEVLSKMLALGLPLQQVIALGTSGTAAALRRSGELGSLAVGRCADVTVMRLVEGDFDLSDGFETITVSTRLEPVGCFAAGEWFSSAPFSVSASPIRSAA